MPSRSFFPLSIAALSCVMVVPALAQMSGQSGTSSTQGSGSQQAPGRHEAMRMVPARAFMMRKVSADKDQVGSQIEAKLSGKVQLHNGPELPAGTILEGKIAKDDMNVSGTSKLALRFTEAKLKDGQTIPIKATIVGVTHGPGYQPDGFSAASSTVPNNWNDGTLAVDEVDAFPGLELKSKIASQNSGVFVAKDKKNMTIGTNRELDLAIAARHDNGSGMNGMSSMHCK